ncbi:diguanylate cyclase [Ruminococcaceae bacterium OttesenSCG-928-O06]|nr:diguanylate cyclase [Ruminococcaceae bacterium OttesenSCG-928-O06]
MLGKKFKPEQVEELVEGVLDSLDTDTLVVRGKNCEILYMSPSARARVPAGGRQTCRDAYRDVFPLLCDGCPNYEGAPDDLPAHFDVTDKDGKTFAVHTTSIPWLDEKPATALYLRDVSEERGVEKKLYNLAYIDQLTGAPNRQKLRESFEGLHTKIENGQASGVLAIFDLDNFKAINDTYGHNTGDIMLRRLTEHLLSNPQYQKNLYRLGGDEFVFLYHDIPARWPTPGDMMDHFQTLFQGAFLNYTMPNIELSCTISMGAAFFPQHGTNFSELLRKADIALYKAKDAGRNNLVFFEDRYDNAKKFKDLYINIQPILTAHGRTFGYELIDRGNEGVQDEDLNLDGADRALDALGPGEMDGDARYFIAYSNQLLNRGVMQNLPKDKFIIEMKVGEGLTAAEVQKCKALRSHGYAIAFTGLNQQNTIPALLALADYCKFEPGATSDYFQKKIIEGNKTKRFIATGVDTVQQFEHAKSIGFLLFQGFFFNQPTVVQKTKDIDPLKVNYLRLLKLTSTDGYVNFQEISTVISSDVALSYKLLRLLNSAAVGLRNPVSSIDMAVAYLGEDALKKWVALLAIRGIASDKPLELVRMSLIRARFGELLAPHFQPPKNAEHVFMVGMFSLLHIALEKTKEELFEEIPVAADIRDSLLTSSGPYSSLVAFYSNYEYANWDEVSRYVEENRLTDKAVNDAYIAAVKWYNDLSDD